MRYNPKIHNRRSIRLKGYDYSQAGFYFITLCSHDRRHIFGRIHHGVMCLNLFGSIAWEEWLKTPSIRPNIGLGAFIVMPNHIHGIIEIKGSLENVNIDNIGKFRSPSQTIGAFVRGYKGATTRRIRSHLHDNNKDDGRDNSGRVDKGARDKDARDKGARDKDARDKGARDKGELQFAPTPTLTIWQRNYYEHIIRDKRAFDNISNYIINNPMKWGKDK